MHPCDFLLVSLVCGLASSLPHPIVKDEDIDITEINKGLDLFEGDIKMAAKTRRRRSIRSEQHRWPLPVPYYLDRSLDMNAKGVILRAFEQFRLKTCIDFRPRRWGEQHVAIKNDTGCWSHVGRQFTQAQDLSIGPNCDTVATVEHELMHALGFWHEQSRYDRDNYITINWKNIEAGKEYNFKIRTNDTNSTMNTPYDYSSVMHYPKDAFTNENGSTIITKLPEFQDVIGQQLDMSHYDVEELNKFYGCSESISFLDHCSFEDESLCEMSVCSRSSAGWQRVSQADGGPHSDHTYLGTGSQGTDFFMHYSTKRGSVGDSARLQTRRMTPRRSCKIQCLEFFYYHSGSWSDQLNIWIREFDGVDDIIETRRLMSQIKGSPADYWQLHHVPLNATKTFQVEFEARKGAGASRGGFSVDDINLSETECPHHTWQIRNFEEKLKASNTTPFLVSPMYYSYDGYRYLIFVELKKDKLEVFVSLVSGINDDALQWPCRWRQVTFTLLDQNPHIQRRMSKQRSVTSTPLWLNSEIGRPSIYGTLLSSGIYINDLWDGGLFMSASELRSREFLKGGDAFLHISMQDISPLRIRSNLPCPSMKGKTFSVSPLQQTDDDGPCGTRPSSTPTLMSTTYTPNTITSTTSTPTTTTSTTSTPTTATSTPTTTTSTTYTPTTATSTPTTTTSTTYTPTTTTSSTYTPTTTLSSTYTPTTTTSSTYTSTTTTSTTYTPITTTSRTTASTTYTPITTTSRTTASTLRPYRVTMQTTTSTSTSGKSTPIDSLNASLSTIRAGNVSTTDSPPVTPPDRCDNIFSVTCYKIEISPGALVLVTLLVFIWGMLCKPCCCKKKRSVPSAENMVFMQMQEN